MYRQLTDDRTYNVRIRHTCLPCEKHEITTSLKQCNENGLILFEPRIGYSLYPDVYEKNNTKTIISFFS